MKLIPGWHDDQRVYIRDKPRSPLEPDSRQPINKDKTKKVVFVKKFEGYVMRDSDWVDNTARRRLKTGGQGKTVFLSDFWMIYDNLLGDDEIQNGYFYTAPAVTNDDVLQLEELTFPNRV